MPHPATHGMVNHPHPEVTALQQSILTALSLSAAAEAGERTFSQTTRHLGRTIPQTGVEFEDGCLHTTNPSKSALSGVPR